MTCACNRFAETVPLDDFLPYVLPQAPNAPAEMAAHYVRLAAIEFARETGVLRERVCVDAQAGVNDYCLEMDGCALNIVSLENVCCGARPLTALRQLPCARSSSPQNSYYFGPPRDLLLWPAPSHDAPGAICADVVLAPGQDACELPRTLYDDFAEVLGDGAASKLLLVKGADWYDPSAAGIYLKRYLNGRRSAKVLASRGFVKQAQYMRAGRFV